MTKQAKQCNRCLLFSDKFYKNKDSADGLHSICNDCRMVTNKKWIEENKEKVTKYSKQWRDSNKDKMRNYVSKYRKNNLTNLRIKDKEYKSNLRKNPEYAKKNRDDVRKWRKIHPDKQKNLHLKRKYGITLKEYKEILLSQDNRCSICNRHKDDFKIHLAVDHNHTTGKVRGLLCSNCNNVLGHAHDNIDVLKKSIVYLKKHDKNS